MGAAGGLLHARVRQRSPQVLSNWSVLTGWVGMGPNWQKSLAHPCTRLHMPGHFLHMREDLQTCLYMPEHSRTTVESPNGGTTNGDGGRGQLHFAEFTQEEIAEHQTTNHTNLAGFIPGQIAEKVGMHRSVVSRDLQSARDVCRSGDSPDLEVARFAQTAIRKRGQVPYTLYEGAARYTTSGSHPHFRSAVASRGGGRILERKEDLRPAGRWIRTPTEVVISICNLTQNNAKQRNLTKMAAILRRFTKTTANSRKFLQDRGIAVSAAQAIV